MTIIANVQTRVLTPRRILLGSGDPNALENVGTEELPDGAQCWVLDPVAGTFGGNYVFRRGSTDPVAPPNVIATSKGAAAPGRWFLDAGGGGGPTSINVSDEGIPQGAATILDFVGPGVTATVAAGTATIAIPGGGSVSGATAAVQGTVNFNGGGAQNIGAALPAGAVVVESKVRVVVPWDGGSGATLELGVAADPDLLLDTTETALEAADVYYDEHLDVLGAGGQIIATLANAGSAAGQALVVVEYIVP